MKYKAKFTGYTPNGLTPTVKPGNVYDENEFLDKGVYVFIPFTETNFFEPVKTRKFVVEVSEENMEKFNFYVNDGEIAWTVTEITEPSWINQYFKSGSYNAHLFSTDELYTIDIEEFKDEYQYGNKLQGVKWLKDRFGKGLRESKELAEFIFAL